MGIERKKIVTKEKKKEDKVDTSRKLKRGFNVSSLSDAIVEGKFLASVGSEVVVERLRNGRTILSICTVNEVTENGLVHTYDQTVEQFFTFSVEKSPRVVKLF